MSDSVTQLLEAIKDFTPEEQRLLMAAWRYRLENRDTTPEECVLYAEQIMSERDRA